MDSPRGTSKGRVLEARGAAKAAGKELTISRRVNAERFVLLGWSRAILLQLAHPLVAAGIHDHSSFRTKPRAAVRRLQHTVRAMLALTFGSEGERERALENIRTIHRRVHGRLPKDVGPFPAGTRYSAEDPALVLWVHATLLESLPAFYERLVAPLTADQRDAYCAEAAATAIELGARPSDVPCTWAALQDYIGRMHASGEIFVGEQARELAAWILSPPFGLLGAPGASVNRLLTLGTLPPAVRRQYAYAWTPGKERAFSLLVPALRSMRQALPQAMATWRAARLAG